jgi:hypothetical protein
VLERELPATTVVAITHRQVNTTAARHLTLDPGTLATAEG